MKQKDGGIVKNDHTLAIFTNICYTYDKLSRVTQRRTINICECSEVIENFTYDAAGNISQAGNNKFTHDANNRLVAHNGIPVTYDKDGNELKAYINNNTIVLNSSVKVGVYIEPIDYLNIHLHDLEIDSMIYLE